MMSLTQLEQLHQQGRYADVLLAVSDTQAAPDGVAASRDAQAVLRLAVTCATALDLPERAAKLQLQMAKTLQVNGELAAAERCFEEARQTWPEQPIVALNAALFFQEQGQLQQAEGLMREALGMDPCFALAYNNLGKLLNELTRVDEAQLAYLEAIRYQPEMTAAHNNLANLFKEQQQPEQAEWHYRRAIALAPNFYEAHNNFGVFLHDSDRIAEAIPLLERAIQIRPLATSAYNNLAGAQMSQLQLKQAEANYRHILTLQPDHDDARFMLALCRLTQGDLSPQVWANYEARYSPKRRVRMTFPPPYPFPSWQGESLQGKRILVWMEQGLGDQIMFSRFLQQLKAQGAEQVILVCHKPLVSLFQELEGVDLVVDAQTAIPWCDFWTYIMSLPARLNTSLQTIPAPIPYLAAKPEWMDAVGRQLSGLLDESAAAGLSRPLKVGVCWQGSAAYVHDRLRSPGLAPFQPLFEMQGVRFFTLLPNSRTEFLAAAGAAGVDWGHEMDAQSPPFEETTALLQQLDLVITADTSIVHLAGALGRPTWLLQPYSPYWTWMVEREDSPWYPSVRLFRQSRVGDWAGVFERVAAALAERLATAQVCGPEESTPSRLDAAAQRLRAPVSTGELLDKISILQIKAERIVDTNKLVNVRLELEALRAVVDEAGLAEEVLALLISLRTINEQLWEIEDEIRKCECCGDFGPKFVVLARSVYQTNDRRAAVKHQINTLSGSALVEEKSYATY